MLIFYLLLILLNRINILIKIQSQHSNQRVHLALVGAWTFIFYIFALPILGHRLVKFFCLNFLKIILIF